MNTFYKELLMRAIAMLAITAATLGGCGYINQRLGLPPDHAVEEFIERIIESETGLDIDLTPGSPEGEGDDQTSLLDALWDKVGI